MMIDEAMAAERPQPGLPMELRTKDLLVRRALLVLQQNLEAPIGVDVLAAKLDVSRRKLERHFTAAVGLTPSQAGKKIRLTHAELLLERSERSVTQIAQDTGFSDVSHLIRVFREANGVTPEVWRSGARGV